MDEAIDLNGVRPLRLGRRAAARAESCATCYWMDQPAPGVMECHGSTPACQIIMMPHPVDKRMARPQPMCAWPPVQPDSFCRHWQRGGAPEEPSAA